MAAPDSGRDHVWFLSPAAVTGVFVVAKLVVSLALPPEPAELLGAAAEGGLETTGRARRIVRIEAAGRSIPAAQPVPDSEAALLELFAREGAVIFTSEEAEVVETASRVFDAHEVRVVRPAEDVPASP